MSKPRFFATTRLVTGGGWHTAYVYDRDFFDPFAGRYRVKAILACEHHHRRYLAAIKCSLKMLRDHLREAAHD